MRNVFLRLRGECGDRVDDWINSKEGAGTEVRIFVRDEIPAS
jgi:hypothetical protein